MEVLVYLIQVFWAARGLTWSYTSLATSRRIGAATMSSLTLPVPPNAMTGHLFLNMTALFKMQGAARNFPV